jgi:UDP-2,3-diacylglucosamine pyrophosphatase LpxH
VGNPTKLDPKNNSNTHAPKDSHLKQTSAQKLVQLTRKPISFTDLCDRLDLSPAKVHALAAKSKIKLDLGNDHVQLSAREQIRTVQPTRILPTKSKRQTVGVISDLHLGSKFCLRDQLVDCVEYMYSLGIRHILCPGDWLDGCYKHGVFELSHTGLEDQTRDLAETLPRKRGLNYHGITGNHDETFADLTGVDVGRYIHSVRPDIHFYGRCGAFLKIYGAVVHLWHPLGGMSYAKSYKLQKQIEKYGAGEKPDILLGGHVHQFVQVEDRGVFSCLCPTFQASGSAFSKRLGGQPALAV